jgi:hypothetical protein
MSACHPTAARKRTLSDFREGPEPDSRAAAITNCLEGMGLPSTRTFPSTDLTTCRRITTIGFRTGSDPMDALYFEDVEVGDKCTAGPYLVTKSEIIQFAKQFDPVPENIDEEAAARSIFGGLTACSPHTFSIYILLTTRLQPKLRFLAGLG